MPTLLASLLNVSSSWLDRWSQGHAGPTAGTTLCVATAHGDRDVLSNTCLRAAGASATSDRQRLALARSRITEARARLNPVRRSARVVCAPHDSCRTVITGRMGDVCEMLDHLVAREAATMRAHAGTSTFS